MTNVPLSPQYDRLEGVTAPPAFREKLAALDREPIVIKGTSGRAVLLLVASMTFVILGVIAILRGEDDGASAGLPAVLIFGLGLALAVAQIMRPAVMTVTNEEVTVKTLFRVWSVRWDEVTGFFVLKARVGPKGFGTATADMAAFNRIDPPRAHFLSNRTREADGAFGPGWPLSAAQLTALLNAARARSLVRRPAGARPKSM